MRYGRGFQLDRIGRPGLQHPGVAIKGGWSDSYILESRDALLEINQLRVCEFLDMGSRERVCLLDDINRVLVRERQGSQQNRVHQRKHGDAHSDAERQTALDHSCRARVSPHADQRGAKVPNERIDPAHPPGLTTLLLDLRNASQGYPREPPGFAWRLSGANMLIRQSVKVELQLRVEIVLHGLAPQ